MSNAILSHKGDKFQGTVLGKYAKDILVQGVYVHPTTGQIVDLSDPARLHRLAHNTELFRKNGNKVPFPDGHTFEAMKNLGDWDPEFSVKDGRLMGIVNARGRDVEERLRDGRIDGVSAYIEFNVTDSNGNKYDEVMTHICATDYAVIPGQRPFVPLGRVGGPVENVPVYLRREAAAPLSTASRSKEVLERMKKLVLSTGGIEAAEKEYTDRPWALSTDDYIEFRAWLRKRPAELARQGANLARELERRPPLPALDKLTETTSERLAREGAELARSLQPRPQEEAP